MAELFFYDFGLKVGGALLFTAVLNSCVNHGMGLCCRVLLPSLHNVAMLSEKPCPLLAAWLSSSLMRSNVALSSNWQGLIQICLMGRNRLLVSKNIRRNKPLVTGAIPYMVWANSLQGEEFCKRKQAHVF